MKNVPLETLSPYEYLEHLQRQEYGSQLAPFAADVGDVLTASLVAALPAEHRNQLEHIAIGVLPTKQVNAWTTRVPAGGEVIGFDFGAMSFLLALNKVLLCRLNILGFEPTLEFEVAAKRAATIVKSFSSGEELPRWPVSPRRMLIASTLSNVQIAFIVGHELGHVLLGHLKDPYWNESRVSELHAMEFSADERGGELALASFKKSHDAAFGGIDTALVQAGPDLFFTYLIFMDRVLGIPVGLHTSSHPASEDRRAKLRVRFSQDMPEQSRALADMAENIFRGFAEMLDTDGDSNEEMRTSTKMLPKRASSSKKSKTPKKIKSHGKRTDNLKARSKKSGKKNSRKK